MANDNPTYKNLAELFTYIAKAIRNRMDGEGGRK